MSTHTADTGSWRLDPSRSSAEFHVRDFYGLMTVKGRFDRDEGAPAVGFVIDAVSLDTGNAPDLAGDTLAVSGLLYAAGKHVPLDIDASVTAVGDAFEVEATAPVDQRRLVVHGRLVRTVPDVV